MTYVYKILFVFLIISVFLFSLLYFFNKFKIDKLIQKGNYIVTKIEIFRQDKKKLPTSIEDVGIKETMEGPIYYQIIDDNTYELSFGLDLGESAVYNSDTKKWYIP